MKKHIHLLDVTLRDGSHAMRHQFSEEQVREVAKGLDNSGIEFIEISHGDGLGGSTIQYGFSKVDELTLIEAAADVCNQAKISVLLLPGIGVKEDLVDAKKAGAEMVRVATHITEADVGEQHIALGRELGMHTVGFLMMAHMAPTKVLVEQAKIFEKAGAEVIYVTDSAGALLPEEVREKITALKENVSCKIGFHGHNNLSLAMANSLEAIKAGAEYIDGSLRSLGAGSGNTQLEVLVAVLDRYGYRTGIDLYSIIDVANDIVAEWMPRSQEIDGESLILGYAGVYSSFLLFAQDAAERMNIDARDILLELGKMQAVGGQEDLIDDIARSLAQGN